jgi:sugar phosphate isomerase/epimerase
MRLSAVVSITATSFEAVPLRGDWRESIRTIGELGFDGVELAVRDPTLLDPSAVADVARRAGVEVASIGTGQAFLQEGLSLTSEDPNLRRRAVGRVQRQVVFASVFGAPVILGLICGRLGGSRRATDTRFVNALEQLLPHADRHRVRLLLEPINRYETDYLTTIDQVLAIIERIRLSGLGVVADTFHMNIEEASIESALRRAGPHLGHVHVADSNRQAPGNGHLDFSRILAVLTEVSYQGYLSAEILPLPNPASAAAQSLLYLRGLLAERHDGNVKAKERRRP